MLIGMGRSAKSNKTGMRRPIWVNLSSSTRATNPSSL